MPAISLVTPDRIEFGYDPIGKKQNRIIIKEKTDASKVRIYDNNSINGIEDKYYCVGCMARKNLVNPAHIINTEVHEPGFHLCTPFSAANCAAEQALFKDKLSRHDDTTTGNSRCSSTSFLESTSSSQYSSTTNIRDANQDLPVSDENDIGNGAIVEKDAVTTSAITVEAASNQDLVNTSDSSKILHPAPISDPSASSTTISMKKQVDTVRKVKYGDYEYGYGNCNQKNNKIVVFEENRNFVRVYIRSVAKWYCHGCYLVNNKKNYGTLKKNVFCPPLIHKCELITREEYEKDQQNIKAKYSQHRTTPTSSAKCSENIQSNENTKEVEEKAAETSLNGVSNENAVVSQQVPSSSNLRLNRIVDLCMDSEYSFNEFAERKKRYTVYEEDRTYVRQYNVTDNELWYCINCTTACIRKLVEELEELGNHECEPLLAAEYKKSDKLLQQQFNALNKKGTKPAARSNSCSVSAKESTQTFAEPKEKLDKISTPQNDINSLRKLAHHEWQFKPNDRSRIIVYENDLKSVVREYSYNEERREIVCIRCLNGDPSKMCRGERNDDDFSMNVPTAEFHICIPIPIDEIAKENIILENSVNRKRARIDDSGEDKSAAIKKSRNTVTVSCEKPEYENDENSTHKRIDILKPSSQKTFDNSSVHDSFTSTNPKNAETNRDQFSSNFLHPGGNFLEQCCKKLKVTYSFNAIMFWSKIVVRQITLNSIPRECFSTTVEEKSAFRCLSLMLTGSEDSFLIIKDALLPYLCNNLTALGEKYGHDLSRPDTPVFQQWVLGEAASKIHFEVLSTLFECQIGIFEDGQWSIYGKCAGESTEKENVCILLLKKVGCKYSVILSLT